MRIDVGSYTGDGSDPKTISLTNCTGDLSSVTSVIFVQTYGPSGQGTCFTTDIYDTDYASYCYGNGAQIVDLITSLTSGAFDVEGLLNASGVTYAYLVLQYDGTANEIETGQYTGNGLDDQDGLLTYGAWVPDFIQGMSESGSACNFRSDIAISTDMANYWSGGTSRSNVYQSVNSGYVQLGNRGAHANDDTEVYNYYVLAEIANYFFYGNYTGNGIDDRSITGAGFQPELSWVCDRLGNEPGWRQKDLSAGISGRWRDTAGVSNHIQDLEADGIQVGTDPEANGDTRVYDWLCWKAYVGAGAPPSGNPWYNYAQQ